MTLTLIHKIWLWSVLQAKCVTGILSCSQPGRLFGGPRPSKCLSFYLYRDHKSRSMHWSGLGQHIVAQSRFGLVQHHQGILWDSTLLFFRGGSILFWRGFSFNCVEYIGVITNLFITCKIKNIYINMGQKKLNNMAFRHKSTVQNIQTYLSLKMYKVSRKRRGRIKF